MPGVTAPGIFVLSARRSEELQCVAVGIAETDARSIVRVHDSAVFDAETVQPVDPLRKLVAAGATETHVIEARPEFGELPTLEIPVVLMNTEQRAVVERPHQVSEAGVGVLVEHGIGTDKRLVPRSADAEIAHGKRDMVERRE